MAEPAPAMLQACRLPQAWGQQSAWRILDTDFDSGLLFLGTWLAWKKDPLRPHLLHYVALTRAPIAPDELLRRAAPFPELLALVSELAPQWFGLLPGFHRLSLDDGRVLLTLCVGEVMVMLREQRFFADSVYLMADRRLTPSWSIWTAKALARCCRRGTTLAIAANAPALHADLAQAGFQWEARATDDDTGPLRGEFLPRWTVKRTRDGTLDQPAIPGTCAVIGAGLAGASVAAVLARRGWQVRVLDQGSAPATGASSLPVGLVVPHVSADDCALSRLSRSGVRLMLQQAGGLLRRGQDWDATGTLERRGVGASGLPADWPAEGRDWSRAGDQEIEGGESSLWHARAAWLKPAALVRAWLAQPGITFEGSARVAAIEHSQGQWELLDATGRVLARADRVVLANASGAISLLENLQTSLPARGIRANQLPAMHGVHGQLSWAMHADTPEAVFPACPVNGSGSVIPAVPVEADAQKGVAWFVGSTYQPDSAPPTTQAQNHHANLERLHRLTPILGQALAKQFASGAINAWENTRCVTSDRLPVVGPLYAADQPGLWICAGMGSRGLSFSVLCAELLAAQWGAEPWPVEAGLAKSLRAVRGVAARTKAPV